ncbi:MAG: nitroreductase family protein [Methanobacterium sp.]|jgi:hypothetical protein
MDLFLSAHGIGSCWQMISKPIKELLKNSNLEFVIFIASGSLVNSCIEKIFLSSKESLQEITDINNDHILLEAVYVAPSAV